MKKGLVAAAIFLATIVAVASQEVRRALPVQSAAPDDVAKFLAGVPLPAGSPLSPLRQSSAYAAHVAALARLSQRYDRAYFSKMRAWSAAELAPRIPMNLPLYYFFGGPDAVSVLALFPDVPVYILGGLESVGSIPAPNTLVPEAVAEGLENLRKSAEVVLSYGHFITKDMKAELDHTVFRGVLPLIYTFIALTGGEILSTRYIGVGSDGTLQESANSGLRGVLPGVRIDFRRGGAAGVQALFYVQANVADDALKSNGALLKWASGFGAGNVYLKAASYLLHESYFSRIRSFLLNQAASVVQDDSGIPFRFFQDGGWRCWFFGTYSGTLDIFAKHYQSDLQAAFAAPGAAAPLPFGTGYKWRLGESNLLLAVKQQVPRAEPLIRGQ
ncbi:MAG TPA: hypothetical protein VIS96_10215 [Terrimicrobiaceae bacterium]